MGILQEHCALFLWNTVLADSPDQNNRFESRLGANLKPSEAMLAVQEQQAASTKLSQEASLQAGAARVGGSVKADDGAAMLAMRALAAAPGKTAETIIDDLKNDKLGTAKRVAEGAVIGAATTTALRFAPKAGYFGLGLAGLYQGYSALSGASDFVRGADAAKTVEQKQALVDSAAQRLGRTAASMTEGAPGLLGGGYAATKAFGMPGPYHQAYNFYQDRVKSPITDRIAFAGAGSERIPTGIVKGDKVDAYALAEYFAQRHAWAGKETGSSINLNTERASRIVTGTDVRLPKIPGQSDAEAWTGHTHKPRRTAKSGPEDVTVTNGPGLIVSGSERSIFFGERNILQDMLARGEGRAFRPTSRELIWDVDKQTARRLDTIWSGRDKQWKGSVTDLDYKSTIETLRNLDKKPTWDDFLKITAAKVRKGQ